MCTIDTTVRDGARRCATVRKGKETNSFDGTSLEEEFLSNFISILLVDDSFGGSNDVEPVLHEHLSFLGEFGGLGGRVIDQVRQRIVDLVVARVMTLPKLRRRASGSQIENEQNVVMMERTSEITVKSCSLRPTSEAWAFGSVGAVTLANASKISSEWVSWAK